MYLEALIRYLQTTPTIPHSFRRTNDSGLRLFEKIVIAVTISKRKCLNLQGTKNRYNPVYTPRTQEVVVRIHGFRSEIILYYIRYSERKCGACLGSV